MTSVIQERDLCRVRLRLIDLCKSFFDKEPDVEKLARWRGIFAALAGAEVDPAFDRESDEIAELLWKKSLPGLQREYFRVIAGPYDEPGDRPAVTVFSFHRNGCRFHETREGIRQLMEEAGIARAPAVAEPEDSLVVLLDILAVLVEEERTGEGWRARQLQGRLLVDYLVPLAHQMAGVLEENEHADFYLRCSRLLCSYLDLETELIAD